MTDNNAMLPRQNVTNIVFISPSLSLFPPSENLVFQFYLISFIGIEVAQHCQNI